MIFCFYLIFIFKATPFGKIPILEIDGKVVNQAVSICRFLAKNADLVGDDDWESLMADISVDNIRDLQQGKYNIIHARIKTRRVVNYVW